jgi:parallel beta-helix repeat protein
MLATTVVAAPAYAQTIDVFPGEPIQAAINQASSGDTIQLHEGVYEDVVSIKTDGITLQGAGSGTDGTILRPPAALPGRCQHAIAGICVLGDPATGVQVKDVVVSDIRVEGFRGFGLAAQGARRVSFIGNTAVDNGEYGIAAFASTGTKMIDNVVSGSGEAGLYVGDSAHANLTMTGNETFDNGFGIFLRDSRYGDVTGNHAHDNCVGILNIDFNGSANAGHYRIADNTIENNSRVCEADMPSGVGILAVNVNADVIENNVISTNHGTGQFHGGVVLLDVFGRPPRDNRITSNELIRNRPNIVFDGSGQHNVIANNDCVPHC